MHHLARYAVIAVLLASAILASVAHAAQSYDSCVGFIDSLPATISTQGTWCLRKDLSTSMTSGNAITVTTNNVTIDCNDFKLGGLAAGIGTQAFGIQAFDRLNVTVRRCNLRGFLYGMNLVGDAGGGHVVEDNRLDRNTAIGLYVSGDGSVVRRNQVRDTGGSTAFLSWGGPSRTFGIYAAYNVDVVDNTVDGVLPAPDLSGDGTAFGIYADRNISGRINHNRVRRLVPQGSGDAFGIHTEEVFGRVNLRDNNLSSDGGGTGLFCLNDGNRAMGNIINGFSTPIDGCRDDGNSL